MQKIKNKVKTISCSSLSPVLKFAGIVLSVSIIHWSLIHFYAFYCAPFTWFGPFTSLLSIGSPVCQFVNYVQFELTKHYFTILALASGVVMTYIISKLNNNNTT